MKLPAVVILTALASGIAIGSWPVIAVSGFVACRKSSIGWFQAKRQRHRIRKAISSSRYPSAAWYS